jgi:hypothetical protein
VSNYSLAVIYVKQDSSLPAGFEDRRSGRKICPEKPLWVSGRLAQLKTNLYLSFSAAKEPLQRPGGLYAAVIVGALRVVLALLQLPPIRRQYGLQRSHITGVLPVCPPACAEFDVVRTVDARAS